MKLDRKSNPLPIHRFPDDGLTQMEKGFIKEDGVKTVKNDIQRLVSIYGICMVLDALANEAARLVLCDYSPEAVVIHDILRACIGEVCNERPITDSH